MAYPIKYIENNLVWNKDGECYAYYELVPLQLLISKSRTENTSAWFFQTAYRTKSWWQKFMLYKSVQNPAYVLHKSVPKNEVTGKLKAVAYDKNRPTDRRFNIHDWRKSSELPFLYRL